MQCACVIDIQW